MSSIPNKKIEITNLMLGFIGCSENMIDHKIVYDCRMMLPRPLAKALAVKDSSLQLDESFYREEWEMDYGSERQDLDGYRAKELVEEDPQEKEMPWPVFEEYRNELSFNRLKEVDDAYRDAAESFWITQKNSSIHQLLSMRPKIWGASIKTPQSMIPEGRMTLLETDTRIYGRNRAVMGQCGINIREEHGNFIPITEQQMK